MAIRRFIPPDGDGFYEKMPPNQDPGIHRAPKADARDADRGMELEADAPDEAFNENLVRQARSRMKRKRSGLFGVGG